MLLIWGEAWFARFAIAVLMALSALWMRSLGFGWLATLGVAVVVWVVLPFVISQASAAFGLAPDRFENFWRGKIGSR